MPDSYKRENIGIFGVCKEFTQGTPNWDLTTTGGGTTTTIVAASTPWTGIDDDFFNDDHYAYCYSGPNAGEMKKITDFVKATGTFTTAAFSNATTGGDRFFIFSPLPASNIDYTTNPAEDLPRDEFQRQTLDPPSSLPGLNSCEVSFDCEIPAMETPSADGTAASKDRFSALLSCIGTRTAKVGEAVTGAASTTTQIDVTDASTFEEGDHVLISGEMRRVTAIDTAATPDNITVSEALSSAPGDATVITTPEQWEPADTGHQSLTFLLLKDDQLYSFVGCVGGFSGTWTFGALQKFSFSFNGNSFAIEDSVDVTGYITQSCELAVPFTSGAAYIGSNAVGLNEVGIDLGVSSEEQRDTDANNQFLIIERKSTLSMKFRNTAKTAIDDWTANKTQFRVLVQGGTAAGGCVGISANGQIESIGHDAVGGIAYHDASMRCVDDQCDADVAYKLNLLRF